MGSLGVIGSFIVDNAGLILAAASVAATLAIALTAKEGGPALGDSKQTVSTYGQAIPITYGENRLGCNMIWSKEPKSNKATFAMGVCEGPISHLRRIWANNTLIYDATDESAVKWKYQNKSVLNIYTGTETQTPDPIIQADVGATLTPAYRGLCYFVMQDFPLGPWGGRIPQLQVEIETNGSVGSIIATVSSTINEESRGMVADVLLRTLYFLTDVSSVIYVDMNTGTRMASVAGASFSAFVPGGFNSVAIMRGYYGDIFLFGSSVTNGFEYLVRLNRKTLSTQSASPADSSSFATNRFPQNACISDATRTGVDFTIVQSTYVFIACGDVAGHSGGADTVFAVWSAGDPVLQGPIGLKDFDDNVSRPVPLASVADPSGAVYTVGWDETIAADGSGNQATMYISQPPQGPPSNGLIQENLQVQSYDIAAFGVNKPNGIYYDRSTFSFVVFGTPNGSGDFKFVRLSSPNGPILASYSGNTSVAAQSKLRPDVDQVQTTVFRLPADQGVLLYPSINTAGTTVILRLDDMTITTDTTMGPQTNLTTAFYYDPLADVGWYAPTSGNGDSVRSFRFRRGTTTPTTLSDIVIDLCSRGGIDPSLVDPDATMDSTVVTGFVVGSQMAVRDALQQLAFAYLFDMVESEYKVKGVTRGGASVRTISAEDLGAAAEGRGSAADPIVETRTQEQEIPDRVDVRYLDKNRDHQEGNQSARRMRNPNPTQYAKTASQTDIAVVLTATQAKRAADAALYNAWVARTAYECGLGPKHLDLDPTDVVTLTRNGKLLVAKMIESNIENGYMTSIKATSDEPSAWASLATGVTVDVPSHPIILPGPTEFFLMDVPLLRDQDDTNHKATGLYLGYGPNTTGWIGAQSFKSDDGVVYTPLDVANAGSAWGYLSTELAGQPLEVNNEFPHSCVTWDRSGVIDVYVYGLPANLVNKTEAEVLNGANLCLIGTELVQYTTVTSLGAGVYRLSVLLRGRFGTEMSCVAGHGLGSQVVFLDTSSLGDASVTHHTRMDLANVNVERQYKCVSSGEPQEDNRRYPLATTAADLKPYAAGKVSVSPASGAGARTATITWLHRTRWGAEIDLNDTVSEVALNETSETYDVVLLHKTLGTEFQVKAVTTASAAFSDAEQAAAGYTSGDPLNVVIYQKSAQVGRGFPRAVTV